MKIHKNEIWLINYLSDFMDKYPEIYLLEVEILEHSCTESNYIMTSRVNDGETCFDSEIYSKYSSILEMSLNSLDYNVRANSLTIGKVYKMVNKR